MDDGSAQVEVEEIDFGEVIELPPEPVAMQNEPVILAEEKNTLEQSGSSEVTLKGKEAEATVKELASSEYKQKQDGVSAVASETEKKTVEEAALPISDTSIVKSSGAPEPVAVTPGDATNGGEGRDLSENPISADRQPAAVLTPHTGTSWTSCCGLFDALRSSNQ